ncbi:CocE/NonD family hydrolase [Micromonospora sp. NBC_01813]|uniref:CocE/NonD family hydrolase n=1 Tax=Micromonospora sp. NBC_01813 TaxID=2975988 RepID=UPI002DDBA988|nr:CocE/NonD family hydrolase [Micromonospora sp. NBC_01813]WSA10784.1 CocE/NonD family hydrolase [Micromonospora sp. NBC_01813]
MTRRVLGGVHVPVPGRPAGHRLTADVYLSGDSAGSGDSGGSGAGSPGAVAGEDSVGHGPVLLVRTAYGRSRMTDEALAWSRRGVTTVVQDVRGRYDSDGDWQPYHHEAADGAATIDWLAQQPWAAGRPVVTYGASYSAFCAWAAAVSRPGVVRAVLSVAPSLGLRTAKFEPSGILRLAEHAGWWFLHGEGRTSRVQLTERMLAAEPDLLLRLPVAEIGDHAWPRTRRWREVLRPDAAAVGAGELSDADLAGLDMPTLHVGGWYDLFLPETVRLWQLVGAAVANRPHRTMVLGPWDHGFGLSGATRVGAREHGPRARRLLGPLLSDWLTATALPAPDRRRDQVTYFLPGVDQWREASTWPPGLTTATIWYATASGALTRRPGSRSGATSYLDDPADPFPSRAPGADRRDLLHRTDTVHYDSGPLPAPVTLAGDPVAVLHVDTDAADTDWVVRLLERRADGSVLSLAHGSARHRPTAADGGIDLRLTPVAACVPVGSALLLQISSSDFPDLARSLNRAGDRTLATTWTVARQRVHHGGDQPTRVVLPVLDEAAAR